MSNGEAWVELVGDLVVARVRGELVVPNSRLAYLARLAFGEGDYRVFYNDMVAAIQWLTGDTPASHLSRIK